MQTKTDTHHAATSQAVEPLAAVRDLLWPASRLGAQLHIGAEELTAAGFGPPRMTGGSWERRKWSQPLGGLWTSTYYDGPEGSTSALVEAARKLLPAWLKRGAWSLLTPDPDALVLVIDTGEAMKKIMAHFRYQGTPEIDFVAVERAGIAGVHLTARAASGRIDAALIRFVATWGCESTVWLRWVFPDPPVAIAVPAWVEAMQAAQWAQALRATNQAHDGAPPVTPGTMRLWLDPPYAGVWLDLRPSTGVAMGAELMLNQKRAFGCVVSDWEVVRMWQVVFDELVVAHNLSEQLSKRRMTGDGWGATMEPEVLLAVISTYSYARRYQ